MLNRTQTHRQNHNHQRHAFTLVELLVAMAVTLLMMVAVARAFSFVGARIRESRGNVQLSNELRDVTTRLNDELTRRTVTLTPNTGGPDQAGYFLYSEGPVTDATSSLFRAVTNVDGTVSVPDSRYGDFDDYLAFTAIAPEGSWFTGKVPQYLLDQRTANLAGNPYPPADDPSTPSIDESQVPFQPVTIRSRYAEIVYFASPEYPNVLPDDSQYVSYVDVDGNTDLGSGAAIENGLPDRMRIHRRVLLIRPDLNLTAGALPVQSRTVGGTTVPFMQADGWPTAATATVVSTATTADGWLYGMAAVHQQCDLSVRRVLNASGTPTTAVAANSLADLSKPHNRFAHVRVPNSVLTGSGGSFPTSMPVLALSGPATILNMLDTTTTNRLAPPLASAGAAPVITPSQLSGFLRREFVLGDDNTHLNPGTFWGLDRRGEDAVVNNALSFDLKIYDPAVSLFATSTGLVASPNDAGYRETILNAIATSTTPVLFGGFVDLSYATLAGGSLRGWQTRPLDHLDTTTGTAITSVNNYLFTPFSGLSLFGTAAASYSNPLLRSGRMVTTGGNSVVLFQPAFDTYTSFYEQDGFLQTRSSATAEGTRWTTTTGASVDLGSDGIDSAGIYESGSVSATSMFGADDKGERETLPPFTTTPSAIQVTIRLENPVTRQIRQGSVTVRD